VSFGKLLIVIGFGLVVLGAGWMLLAKFGVQLGRLPGDIVWKKGNTTLYFPITTCVVISIILTFILWLFKK